jgi:hypothetical protein
MKTLLFYLAKCKANLIRFSFLSALIITVMMQTQILAQTTVQVGSGTTTNTYFPIYTCYGYNYSQQIYTSAEISAAGGFAGTISQIRFFWASGGTTTANWNNWTVYLGNTALSNFTGAAGWVPTASMTQVFSGNISPTAGGWVTVNLTTPFNYTGGNLVVGIDENSASWSCTAAWRNFTATAAAGPRAILYYSDGTNPNPASPPSANYTSTTSRAQIQLDITPSTVCSGVPNAGAATISAGSGCVGASLTLGASGLTTGTGISYQWQSGPTSSGPWTNISGATTASTTVSSVSGLTYYRLVTTCANSASSNNTNTVSYNGNVVNGCTCLNYGSSGATSIYDDEIFNVTFGGINNTSTCASTAPGAGSLNRQYSNYTGSVPAANVMQGVTYPLSVTAGQCDGWAYGGGITVYIDYNQNGSFADAGEMVYASPYSTFAVAGTVFTANITVPLTATVGLTRMRVICAEETTNIGSTTSYGYGETEDYCIDIAQTNQCLGTPNSATATISSTSGCPNASFNLGATGISTGLGLIYQWQSAPSATGPWTNIAGATSTSYSTSVTSLGSVYYRLVTTCINSVISSYSSAVSYTATGGQCDCGTYPAIYSYYTGDEEISSVTVGTMTNTSNCSTLAPGPGSLVEQYGNYTGSVTGPSVNQGDVVNFSLTQTTCGWYYNNIFQIFVDFNQDGDFLDAGEFVYNQPAAANGNQTVTGSFLVPANATLGTTRMRIVNAESGPTATNYAHNQYYWGETEDYCFTVTLPPPCAGTPTPGNTLASASSVFAGQSVTLSLQNNTSGTGITYQWQSASSAAGPWTDITGANAYNLTITPTAMTWYQCIVTCTNSASSAISTPVQVLYNPYCDPQYYYGTQYGDLISNVAITGTSLNNNSGTAAGGPSYTYYNNLPPAIMAAASSYQVQVTCGSYAYQAFSVWIDYNDNNVFEASENVGYSPAYTTSSFQTVSFNINLACTPPLGIHRMRVRGVYYTPGASIDPCATYYYGETEDYDVQIIAAVPFAPSFTAVPSNQACTYTDYTYTTQSGMQTYYWTFPGTAGVDYNIISGGTTTSNTATVQYLAGGNQTVVLDYLNASGCVSTGAVNNTITVQSTAAIAPLAGTQTVCAGASVNFSTASAGGTWSSSNPAIATINPSTGEVMGVSAGTATMTYTILNPTTWCPPSTATRTVTVLPSPIVDAGADVTICSGQSNTMNSSVNFNTSCTHTILLYDSYGDGWNGCTATVYVAGVPVLSNIGIVGWGSGPVPFTFTASNGDAIQVTFSPGSWASEPYYTIQDGAGNNLVTNWVPYWNGTWNGTAAGCPSITPTWTPSASLSNANILNPVATPATTTTYTVSATGTNGCVGTDMVTINVNQSPANAPIVAPTALCVGSNAMVSNPVPNGVWGMTVQGNVSMNTASGSIVGLSPGTATITYTTTAPNGCTTVSSSNIDVQALPVASISSSNGNSVCQGSSTTLSAPAAAAYLWNNGATTQDITLTAGGSYSVTITSAAGCVSAPSAMMSLTVNQPPVATVALSGPTTFCDGGSVDLTANGGVSYVWNNNVPTATNSITTAGTYTATVTDANGCSATTAPITVTVMPAPSATITASGPLDFCAGGSVLLSANGAGTYAWTNGSTASSVLVSSSGSHELTITGSNGCSTTSAPAVVTVTPMPVVDAISGSNTVCEGATTTMTNLTPSGVWSSSNTAVATIDAAGDVTGVSSGTVVVSYTVTTNGCSTTVNKNLSVQAAPTTAITASGPTTFCDGGSVVLTAANGTAFAWSNASSSQTIAVTQSGTYSVAVTNGLGCVSNSAPITVNVLSAAAPVVTANNTAICQGASATLTSTSAAAYLWSNGATTPSINVSTAGNYTVSIIDANGCSATSTPIAITSVAAPSISIAAAGPVTFCQGQSVVLNSNTNGSTFAWNTGATTPSITATSSGLYYVTVTNAQGCTAVSNEITVTTQANFTPVITAASPTIICDGAFATLVATPGASYLWSNNATTQGVNVGVSGPITVTVTTSQGCVGTSAPINITVLPVPTTTITASGPTTFCEGGSVTLTAGGANSYMWANNSTATTQTVTTSGTYVVTGYSVNGCPNIAELVITVNEAPSFGLILDGNTGLCPGESLTLTAQSGNTYNWTPTGATSQSLSVAAPGTYSCNVTNASGCTTVSEQIVVTAAQPTSSTLNITSYDNYVLNEITYTQSGTYTQTLTNAAGCDSTITLNLTLTVGLDENGFVSIAVQPNPTDAVFTLMASEALHSIYTIQDAQGKIVATGQLTGTATSINIENVARGIYFLKVAEASEALRIVKN